MTSPNDSSPKVLLPLGGFSILVVDDHADTLEMEAVILGQAGAEVACADSVDRALQVATKRRPDLVLCDVGMPGKDGWTLPPALRSAFTLNGPALLLVALSAHASESDANEAMVRGYDLYLVKPIHPDHLVDALAKLLRRET
jgi:CheY-like chemotaxis protein